MTNLNDINHKEQYKNSSSSKMLAMLFDSHDDMIFYINKNYIVENLNVAALRFMSLSHNEAVGRNFFDIISIDFSDTFKNKIENLINSDDGYVEELLSSLDDQNFNIKISTYKEGLLISIKNVNRKTDNIDESNFKMLFENMSSAFLYLKAIYDNNGNIIDHQILDVNSTFEMVFDRDRDLIVGKNLSVVMPIFNSVWCKILAKSARTGGSYTGNYQNKINNRHFEVRTYSPRKGFSAAVFNDIRQEMEIRNDLMVKNEISKAFAIGYDTSLYKVILNLVLKNTGSKKGFLGYVSEENKLVCFARNGNDIESYTDEHGNIVLNIEKYKKITQVINENRQITSDNIAQHENTLLTPIEENNKVIGLICCADSINGYSNKSIKFVKSLAEYISPLMSAEIKERTYKQELVAAKELAEHNEKLKTAFLANISQEIKTPMNSISGFSQLLNRADNLTEKQHKYATTIIQSVNQLIKVVDDLLDLSKLETHQYVINYSRISINKLLREIYKEVEKDAKEKSLTLSVTETLPDSEDIMITDKHKIKKTIHSMVVNGIKYTDIGSVSYGYNIENEYITFFVKDTGIGIRKEVHESIFNSFHQEDKILTRNYAGIGIGLTLCKGFVTILGGEITLISAPNQGSTFYVKIPRNLDMKLEPKKTFFSY